MPKQTTKTTKQTTVTNRRTERPGRVGLANEVRPGLGTRADTKKRSKRGGHYAKRRPAPREQAPDSMAHELERSTAMSGQSSGT
jgi:hypothetical protein